MNKAKLEIIYYHDAQKFLDQYHDELQNNEALYQLLLVNLYTYVEKDIHPDYLGVVKNEDQLVLVFLNPLPFNLQIITKTTILDAIVLLVNDLVTKKIVINGVQGDEFTSKSFRQLYPNQFSKKFHMNILTIDKLNEVPKVKGILTVVDINDSTLVEKALSGIQLFHQEIGSGANPDEIKLNALTKIQKHMLYVFINEDSEITSLAYLCRPMEKTICITGVYTFMKYRNQGYAKQMMYDLVTLAFNRGYQYCSLFVDQENPISNQVYKDVGFKTLTTNYDYHITK